MLPEAKLQVRKLARERTSILSHVASCNDTGPAVIVINFPIKHPDNNNKRDGECYLIIQS